MSETIEFTVPGIPPAACSPNSRAFWGRKAEAAAEYQERVVCAWIESEEGWKVKVADTPWAKAHLTLTQRAMRLRDHDNFYASFKPGQDALTVKGARNIGLLADDTPSVLSVTLRAEYVPHKHQECVVIRLCRMEDA